VSQRIDGYREQLFGVAIPITELGEEQPHKLVRLVGRLDEQMRSALHDAASEQPFGRRRGIAEADLPPAARLSEDGDIVGVAAKGRDILLHPAQGSEEIEKTGIARGRIIRAQPSREMAMAEDVE